MAASIDVLDPSWINQIQYDAEELRRAQGFQLSGGATPGSTRTGVLNPRDLVLSLSGSNVLVGPGGCAIGSAKGAYVAGVAATTTVGALTVADVTNPRRDRVVLEILDPDNGGGAGRKAQLRIIDGTPNASAATGGGFPAAPTSPFIDLGWVDVPKAGAGNPVASDGRAFAVASGGTILVRTLAERNTLPLWVGLTVARMDVGGIPLERYDGIVWRRGLRMEIGQGANDPTHAAGVSIITTNASGDASIVLPVPFGSTLVSYTLTDATSPVTLGPIILKATTGSATKSALTLRAYTTAGVALANQLIAVSWSADGY